MFPWRRCYIILVFSMEMLLYNPGVSMEMLLYNPGVSMEMLLYNAWCFHGDVAI